MIDQSGIPWYNSGVDDFDAYVANRPFARDGEASVWWSQSDVISGPQTAILDFDLGGTWRIESIAFWNMLGSYGFDSFDVLVSDDASFTDAKLLGNFTAVQQPAVDEWGEEVGNYAQVFELAPTTGSFVRLRSTGGWAWEEGFNEIAFEVAPVPEPETYALMAGGLTLLAWAQRRRRTATAV
ncbi:PEP-CTERM sorting domain-containing protein [Aquabacterium sp. A7-Y]|uniref:PEP-CTERM sorting domain-containing protein n=1 Tax=Aquabacterium sp. A7-Y TaxID=1349605 RepID=UPI00223DFCD8|nr:PEP-CTERM sorting domain-containing protein [Aquabacterium sp. A7-Y]MCW7536801.1 PEP-CTERM sorting domain-containing protein [Aquabacterium sp. A7-Y]